MTQYGTIEYYQEEINNKEIEKQILLNALIFEARKDYPNFEIIDTIAVKLNDVNNSLRWASKEIIALNEKDKSEENAD